MIDDLPSGPREYPPDRLHAIKAEHEREVTSQSTFDANRQLYEEQWAAIIDTLDNRMPWDSWTQDMSLLFSHDQHLHEAVLNRLRNTSRWILGRAWPPGHTYLRETINSMMRVMDDLIYNFECHMVETRPGSGIWRTEKFYKIQYWDPDRSQRLLAEYEFHTALIEDLCFELTRYGNLIACIVRSEIDPAYRFEQGVLVIRYGIDIMWPDTPYRPEFAPGEIEGERQPYTTLEEFLKVRSTRELSEASAGNPRTAAGRQDPTKRPGS